MKFTLRTKFIVLITFIVAAIMIDITYFFTIRQLKDKRTAFENQMARIAKNIATLKLLDRPDWNDYQNYISQLMDINDDIVYIAIYDDRGWLRAHTLNTDLIAIDSGRTLSRRARAEYVRRLDRGMVAEESRNDFHNQKVNILSGDRVLGSVHVGFSLIEINNELQNRIARNVFMALIFIVIFSVIAIFLSRKLIGPLERLSAAMTGITKGNLNQQIKVESKDEIGQLARTFNQMVEGLREWRIIENLNREMTKSFHLEHLANLVRDRLGSAIDADQARLFLHLKNKPGYFKEFDSRENKIIKLNDKTQSYLMKNTEGFLLDSAPRSVIKLLQNHNTGCKELIVPMLIKERLFGLLTFCIQQQEREFSEKERRFVASLTNQAAMALDNAMLYKALREQERIKHELEIARNVQSRLLPVAMPQVIGFQIDGICYPAQEVGGDYFDFFPINPNRLGIVIADVSGKGTSASFYMAEIKGMMSILAYLYPSPKELLCELNKRLSFGSDLKIFATMIYGVLDNKSHTFTFVRAGHDALLHITAKNRCSLYTPSGIGLGLVKNEKFDESLEEMVVELNAGDTMVLFTDGITEAMNNTREEFGEHRLLKLVQSNHEHSAVALRHRIIEEIDSFVDGARQHDDLTMVIVHHEQVATI
ncbi:MAG: HAMP domain-containing protein [Calditrichaeota bacterium]|nr:MAG: HAMP domain-containing protein [Calditrichota bacterium]